MAGIFQRLKKIFAGGETESGLSLEELRNSFKTKFHAFKLLLNANNTALQLMTDMEAALHGNFSFGMTFIRSHCTAVCVNVFSLIRSLNELSGNRYQSLAPVFESIQAKIDGVLRKRQALPLTDLVLPLEAVTKEMADGVGSKMANLGEIKTRLPQIPVPPGQVITAAAYELFLTHNRLQEEINRRLQSLEKHDISDLHRASSEIQMLIINGEVPPELAEAIFDGFDRLRERSPFPSNLRVSLRSSAIGEDAVDTSFEIGRASCRERV